MDFKSLLHSVSPRMVKAKNASQTVSLRRNVLGIVFILISIGLFIISWNLNNVRDLYKTFNIVPTPITDSAPLVGLAIAIILFIFGVWFWTKKPDNKRIEKVKDKANKKGEIRYVDLFENMDLFLPLLAAAVIIVFILIVILGIYMPLFALSAAF